MLLNELRKDLLDRFILSIYIVFLILVPAFFYYGIASQSDKYSPDDYKKLWEGFQTDDAEKLSNELSKEILEMEGLMTCLIREEFGDMEEGEIAIDLYEELKEKYLTKGNTAFSVELSIKIQLYRDVIEELGSVISFSEGVETVISNADRLKRSGKADENEMEFVKSAFGKIADTKVSSGPSKGISKALSDRMTDIFAIAFVFITAIFIVSHERNKGLLRLVKTTKGGRTGLALCKLAVVFSSAVFSSLFYLENIIVSGQAYGLGDIGRPIQSVLGFDNCTWNISVLGMFVLFILSKVMVVFCAGAMFLLLCTLIRNSVAASAVSVGAVALSTAVFYAIKSTSKYVLIKYLSLFGLADTYGMLSSFKVIHFAGGMIERSTFSLIAMVAFLLLFSTGSVISFSLIREAGRNTEKRQFFRKFLPDFLRGKHVSIFRHELYKSVVASGAGLIFIAGAVIILLFRTVPYESYNDMQLYYRSFERSLEGKHGAEADKIITDYIAAYSKEYDASLLRGDNKGMRSAYYALQACEELQRHNDYLKGKEGAYFTDTAAFNILTGNSDRFYDHDLISACLAAVLSSVIFCAVFCFDTADNEIKVIDTTLGRNKCRRKRYAICAGLGLAIWAVCWLPGLISIINRYSIGNLSASAYCLEHLSHMPQFVSVGAYIAFIYALRLIGVWGIMILCSRLAYFFKSFTYTCVFAFLLFVLPLCIMCIGISSLWWIMLNPLFVWFP